jgi:hypothetical protein
VVAGWCHICTYDQSNVIDIPLFISYAVVFAQLFLRKDHVHVQSTAVVAVVIPIRIFLLEVSVFLACPYLLSSGNKGNARVPLLAAYYRVMS